MARLKSTLEIGLDNNASPGIRDINRDLDGLRDSAGRRSQALADARGQMLDAAAAGWALYHAIEAPISAGLKFSSMLEDIGQKSDLSRGQLAEMGKEIRALGLSTAQGASEVGKSVDLMMGYGFSEDVGLAVSEPIGKAATAYNAATEDLASASAALIGNLRVPAEEVGYALDIMAKGGKEGAFEIADMAAEFASLTAAAQTLGIEGTKGTADLVAMLEVARKGAASGSEAATNTANFMQKILSPDALKKFGAAGVDMVKEMDRATKAGKSPVEHALGIINKLTKGGKQDLLGNYFADSEVQKFIRPMLANMEEYRRIRAAATDSVGVIDADFQEKVDGPSGVLKRFSASVENLNIVLGQQLLPELTELVSAITPVIDGLAAFVEANGELTAEIVTIAAALVGLRVLAAAGKWGGAFMTGGALLGGKGPSGPMGRGGARGGKIGPNLGGLGALGLINGIGVAADLSAFQGAMKEDGGKAWAEARAKRDAEANAWLESMSVGGFKPFEMFTGARDYVHGDRGFSAMGPNGYKVPSDYEVMQDYRRWPGVASGPGSLPPGGTNGPRIDPAQSKAEGEAAGAAMGQGVQAGLSLQAGAIAQELRNMKATWQSILSGGLVLPVHTAGEAGKPLATRAGGGRVWAGEPFLVGEHGPELVTFGGEGVVHPAGDTARMMATAAPYAPSAYGVAGGGSTGNNGSSGATITVGDIHVSLGMMGNSNPPAIAREIGVLVKAEIEAMYSDAAMA